MALTPGPVYQGMSLRLKNTYRDSDGALISPDVVSITLFTPCNIEYATYTLGIDDGMQELSTGKFACDFTVGNEPGVWRYEWTATDDDLLVTAIDAGRFVVQTSPRDDVRSWAYPLYT